MYRLATNGEKADGHQKQTSVRNCELSSTIGYHNNSWTLSSRVIVFIQLQSQ